MSSIEGSSTIGSDLYHSPMLSSNLSKIRLLPSRRDLNWDKASSVSSPLRMKSIFGRQAAALMRIWSQVSLSEWSKILKREGVMISPVMETEVCCEKSTSEISRKSFLAGTLVIISTSSEGTAASLTLPLATAFEGSTMVLGASVTLLAFARGGGSKPCCWQYSNVHLTLAASSVTFSSAATLEKSKRCTMTARVSWLSCASVQRSTIYGKSAPKSKQ
mmetsp:Transcript_12303/g.23350  ORF Transcript_12303/g.23350 Transcript_12303/m.23350 type:complete len:218 (+) Transcript_12303:5366-6019(+)